MNIPKTPERIPLSQADCDPTNRAMKLKEDRVKQIAKQLQVGLITKEEYTLKYNEAQAKFSAFLKDILSRSF